MKENFDYIVKGNAPNVKYINGYKKCNDYYELHITNLKDKNFIFKIDLEDFDLCKYHFWSICFVGKKENKQPRVYYTKNRIKYYLNKFVLKIDNINNKVIFKNRDCYDYRKCNLYQVKKDDIFLHNKGKTNKNGGDLPTGITLTTNSLGHNTGYTIYFKKNGKKTYLYFGIKKFKTLDNCLKVAIETKKSLMTQ